jgi:hypothetical protein
LKNSFWICFNEKPMVAFWENCVYNQYCWIGLNIKWMLITFIELAIQYFDIIVLTNINTPFVFWENRI